LEEQFSFLSTAGGAMLEFLLNGTLPGIEALKEGSVV
jgi:3-phosphoglycerate kinase